MLRPGSRCTNGTPTSIIRWGDDTPQSGYDFNAANPLPPPFELPGPLPFFSLGEDVKMLKTSGMTTIKVASAEQAIAELETVLGVSLR